MPLGAELVYSHTMLLPVSTSAGRAGLLKKIQALQSCHCKVPFILGTPFSAKALHRPFHDRLRGLFQNKSCSMSTDTDPKYADFFRYTGGRWLWDEEEQLFGRYKAFNVPELQRVAAKSVGAHTCVSMTKLGEGSYNKVFRLIMDNGVAVIARVPNPNAGPVGRTTASEVATMDLVF